MLEDVVHVGIGDVLPQGGGEPEAVVKVWGSCRVLEEAPTGVVDKPACEITGETEGGRRVVGDMGVHAVQVTEGVGGHGGDGGNVGVSDPAFLKFAQLVHELAVLVEPAPVLGALVGVGGGDWGRARCRRSGGQWP